MTGFASPYALVLLVGVPVMAFWYWRAFGRDAAARDAFAERGLHKTLGLGLAGKKVWTAPILICLSLALAALAAARPLGKPVEKPPVKAGMDVIIALDVSDSMAVPDMDGPRLAAAKQAVAGLVTAAPANRYGLVVFSGEATVTCPLTTDHDTFLTFLNGVGFSHGGLPGSAIGEAVLTASTRFKKSGLPRAVVVVSDGENTYGADPADAAKGAKGLGVKVYAIGVGTPSGGRIPVGRDFFGKDVFKRDRAGRIVNSALDERLLKEVASSGGGAYFHAADEDALKALAKGFSARPVRAKGKGAPEAEELSAYFALGAFTLLAAAMIF